MIIKLALVQKKNCRLLKIVNHTNNGKNNLVDASVPSGNIGGEGWGECSFKNILSTASKADENKQDIPEIVDTTLPNL